MEKLLPFLIAFLGGFLPAFVWLVFWNEEDSKRPEPKSMIALAFAGGVAAVFVSLLLEKIAYGIDPRTLLSGAFSPVLSWLEGVATAKGVPLAELFLVSVSAPAIEEILKFAAAYALVMRAGDDEPIDPIMYLITTALGFAAMENMLFLLGPIAHGDLSVSVYTGDLRFVGAMLLHTVSSATAGFFVGLSMFKRGVRRRIAIACGLIAAIVVHGAFNFLMIGRQNSLVVLEIIWMAVIIILLALEKVKRMRIEKI